MGARRRPSAYVQWRQIPFRLYTFDGATLDTIWAPDDMLSAKLRVADGFAITHLVHEDRSFTTEQYKATANGLVRVR